jgi:hypothetical protein
VPEKEGGEMRFLAIRFDNRLGLRDETMQPAYLFAVISVALATAWGPPEPSVMPNAYVGNAYGTEDGEITGSIPAVLYRVTGEALTCEQIRLIDEVELIADESYCG